MSKINITSLEFDSEFDLEPIRVINQWAELYAPNKKTMTKIRLYHTRNECMGGY